MFSKKEKQNKTKNTGEKVPYEIKTLENDPEIGKGNTLEVIGKHSQSKQGHPLKGVPVRHVAGDKN